MKTKFPLSLSVCFSCRSLRPNRLLPPPLCAAHRLSPLNDPSAAAKALCRDHQRCSPQEAEEAAAKERRGPEREARCREPEEGPDSRHQVSFSLRPSDHCTHPVTSATSCCFRPPGNISVDTVDAARFRINEDEELEILNTPQILHNLPTITPWPR